MLALLMTNTSGAAASTDAPYQVDAEEVLPKRCSVSNDGWQSSDVRLRPAWIASITPRPPVWMRKRSNARLKSGM